MFNYSGPAWYATINGIPRAVGWCEAHFLGVVSMAAKMAPYGEVKVLDSWGRVVVEFAKPQEGY